MLDNKLCLTSVVEFLRKGRVDRGTREGKIVVVIDLSKRKVNCRRRHISSCGHCRLHLHHCPRCLVHVIVKLIVISIVFF